MKKIIMLSLLVCSVIWAQEGENELRIKTMQNLENGMETILKGLMYNNKNIILNGVNAIEENTKNISLFDIKNEEGVNFKAKKYSKAEAQVLTSLAENILTSFKKGDRRKSLNNFKRLQNQCMNCHALIRKW